MTTITRKGREIAQQMIKHFDRDAVSTDDLARPLSLLGRLAPAYARIQEVWCSEETTERRRAWLEKREKQIEDRARAIVATMPAATTGKLEAVFTGDPRGYTLRVKVPGAERDGNAWGQGGEYGVG